MKTDIHPKYFEKAQIICACGNKVETGATKEKIEVEVCNHCHPLFSNKEKTIDIGGQIEKFKQRIAKKDTLRHKTGAKKTHH